MPSAPPAKRSGFRLGIQWKLLFPFSVTLLLVFALLLPVTTTLITQGFENAADNRLSLSALAAAGFLETSQKQALLGASAVANLPQVEGLIGNLDAAPSVLQPRKTELGLRELSLYSAEFSAGDTPIFYGGPPVTRRLQVSQSTTEIRDRLILNAIRSGQAGSAIAIAPQSSQIIGVAPVHGRVNPSGQAAPAASAPTTGTAQPSATATAVPPDQSVGQVKAVILAVYSIDDEYMAQIKRLLGVDTAIVKDNDIIVSSIDRAVLKTFLPKDFIESENTTLARTVDQGGSKQRRALARPLMLSGQTQGTIIMMQPVDDLLQVQQGILTTLLLFAGLIAVLTTIFAILSYINFAKPLKKLANATRDVSAGDFNQQIIVPRLFMRDEIGDLADNFNMMTGQLHALYEGLEQKVAERTHELLDERGKLARTMDQLAIARDQALEASRAKSTFLANMSHELRTPLNAIIGYSEMLMEEAEDSEELAHFAPDMEKIRKAGKHLLAIINDILDISKIEAGKMDLYLEKFDLNTLIDEIVATVQPLMDKNHNKFEVVRDRANLGIVRSDMTKTRQIIFNLLSNAAKFTNEGTITLDIKRTLEDGRERIMCSVSDTGIGMTPEQLAKLFREFTQADSSTTRKFGGTGLGLHISRRFAEMMGGTITVTSEYGQGTTFTLDVPAHLEDKKKKTGETGKTSTQEMKAVAQAEQLDTATIKLSDPLLVIDDDPSVRDLLVRTLSKEGMTVVTASSGAEGLRLARELHPQFITLDLMMPDMDGWAVLSTLKIDPTTADIPVVIMTMIDNKNLGFALGAADYLLKPVDRDRLIAILNRYRKVTPLPDGLHGRLLVVEDEPDTREMMRRTLEKELWLVDEAENGKVALQRVAAAVPDMIFLDLMMPEMDGFQFIEELRKRPEWMRIPVIVVTAKELTSDDRRHLNGHIQQIVQKGLYDRESLLQRVRELVSVNKSTDRQTAVE